MLSFKCVYEGWGVVVGGRSGLGGGELCKGLSSERRRKDSLVLKVFDQSKNGGLQRPAK